VERPVKAVTPPAPSAESWSRIDARSKPSKAVSKDELRPALKCGWIRHEDDGSFLYCTDSYILIALPITMEVSGDERSKVLPEVGLMREALLALDSSKSGEFRIVDGLIEVSGNPALFRVTTDCEPPNFRTLLDGPSGKKASLDAIGFNPRFLVRVSEGLGVVDGAPVTLRFTGTLNAIRVEPGNHVPGEALIMPVRTAV
jgi:hypothetical protein